MEELFCPEFVQNKNAVPIIEFIELQRNENAEGGSRTRTALRPSDFKSDASPGSATSPWARAAPSLAVA